jgi:flavin reductase (DIM6/NTAB) family NADH-FMN oxidoreductase RutF
MKMKIVQNPFTALFPCPVVLITCTDLNGIPNIITLAWVGVACSNPPTIGLGIRPSRHSYRIIEDVREFVINIPTKEILEKVDYCGSVSGKDVPKFSKTGLTPENALKVKPPLIKECPVNIECILKDKISLGSHDLFVGEVVQVHVEQEVLNERGKIDFSKLSPFVYNQGEYWSLNQKIGEIGFSKKK